jgi:hypothetical protein
MSTPQRLYTIISQLPTNQWSDTLGAVQSGYLIRAQSAATNQVVAVFVPIANYTPAGVAVAVSEAIANSDAIHSLGAAP